MTPVLRLYPDGPTSSAEPPPSVAVPFAELVSALRSAGGDAAWLDDFADDEVRIGTDLYEVLSLLRSRERAA
ncbi:MAG: hypothetical protein AAF532_15655 [Planctomycetota bacterium]